MEHVHPLDRLFPWRTAALVAGVVALAELTALIALASVRVFHVHHSTTSTPVVSSPSRTATKKPAALPLRPRSRVTVLVLNGNGVAGAAGTEATRLLSSGYRHALAADAPSTYAQSVVLFRPGWQREAQRLAHDVGIRAVTPLDVTLAPADRGDQVVLILGSR